MRLGMDTRSDRTDSGKRSSRALFSRVTRSAEFCWSWASVVGWTGSLKASSAAAPPPEPDPHPWTRAIVIAVTSAFFGCRIIRRLVFIITASWLEPGRWCLFGTPTNLGAFGTPTNLEIHWYSLRRYKRDTRHPLIRTGCSHFSPFIIGIFFPYTLIGNIYPINRPMQAVN